VEAYLLDTPTPEFGGSGRTFDWSRALTFPYRAIVAGGLDASNVGSAIAALQPWGVDACSRLESRPGKKDEARMRGFIDAALRAALESSEPLRSQEVSFL
jgi:phosphoribosylanthranilate isomerase